MILGYFFPNDRIAWLLDGKRCVLFWPRIGRDQKKGLVRLAGRFFVRPFLKIAKDRKMQSQAHILNHEFKALGKQGLSATVED